MLNLSRLFAAAVSIAMLFGSMASAWQINSAPTGATGEIAPGAYFNAATGSALIDSDQTATQAPATVAQIGDCHESGQGCCGNASGCENGYGGCDGCGGGCGTPLGCGGGCSGCDSGCGTPLGCGCGGKGCGLFGNILKPSCRGFDDFISPMTNPVFFEDPRNLTEARFIFLNHKVPTAAGAGDVRLYALQLRARLADNVSLIATKDGYIDSTNPLVIDGWADLSAGLKFNLVRDIPEGRMWSAGFTYEIPSGARRAQQANGDGVLNMFVSGGRRINCRAHWLTSAGWRLPLDDDANSESVYWSNHFDYQLTNKLYGLLEFNWYHWTQSGAGGVAGVEGLDLFNLGSTGVTGNDIITAAFGGKLKPSRNSEIGLAWEFPLTQRRDIIDNRLTFDWIFRY